MNAILSPADLVRHPPARALALSDGAVRGLRWSLIVALTAAAAALMMVGPEMFQASVASQLASGVLEQGLVPGAMGDPPDPFYQQKLDAKIEELPAQF